jgi:formate hydrogenlyase transcriptional activator
VQIPYGGNDKCRFLFLKSSRGWFMRVRSFENGGEVHQAELIGSSASFDAALKRVGIVAAADSAVLIQGETGTGKELIARAIHNQSSRRHAPFVKINCAAIPTELLESELFGHEKGAFTGAIAQTMGRFQLANKGTLFLDEIGDLPLQLQPKLLRVLQEQEFERLGSARTIKVDVRVVAATNQDLPRMVQDRQFRADLYYRLNVFPICLPPLRDRSGDIPCLVRHFIRRYSLQLQRNIQDIPDEALDVLKRYDWPGNIRELQNFIERAVLMSTGPSLDTPLAELTSVPKASAESTNRTLAEAERDHILDVLGETNGLVGGKDGAAVRLGLPRTTLIHKMHRLGIGRGSLTSPSALHTRRLSRTAPSTPSCKVDVASCRRSLK